FPSTCGGKAATGGWKKKEVLWRAKPSKPPNRVTPNMVGPAAAGEYHRRPLACSAPRSIGRSGHAWLDLSGELGAVDPPAVLRHDPISRLGRALVDLDDQGCLAWVDLGRDIVDEILVHPQFGQVANRS